MCKYVSDLNKNVSSADIYVVKTLSTVFIALLLALVHDSWCEEHYYGWSDLFSSEATIRSIKAPAGYDRLYCRKGTFSWWLRNLPLKEKNTLYHSKYYRKNVQSCHHAIIDIDSRGKDLQKGVGFAIRFVAEYLFATNKYHQLCFTTEKGVELEYFWWMNGYRPDWKSYTWNRKKQVNSYAVFTEFLDHYIRAARDKRIRQNFVRVNNIRDLRIGDLITRDWFEGSCAIVVDAAWDKNGQKAYLFAFNSIPEHEIHVVRNDQDRSMDPWYEFSYYRNEIRLPEAVFSYSDIWRVIDEKPELRKLVGEKVRF